MTVLAKKRLYQDILPYVRREPHYSRPRVRPAQSQAVPAVRPQMPAKVQHNVRAKAAAKSIDGVMYGRSRTVPVVQPYGLAPAQQQKAAVHPKAIKNTRHFDVIANPQQVQAASEVMMQPIRPQIQPLPVQPHPQTRLQAKPSLQTQQSRLQPQSAQVNTLVAQQFSSEPEQEIHQSATPRRSKFLQLLPVGLAAMMFIAGVSVFAWTVRTNRQVIAQDQFSSVSGSSTVVEEEPAPSEDEVTPAAVSSYRVSPDMPRTLTIDKIEVFSRIKSLGVLRSGTLAAPSNINDTGWYEGSSKPGDSGAMLLVGHVYGPNKPGVFKNLHKLEAGDVVTVARGDGQEYSYKVVKKEQATADQIDIAATLVPVTPGKAGLNIITSGELIPGTTNYADSIVVYAEQI